MSDVFQAAGQAVDPRSLSGQERDRYICETPLSNRWLAKELGISPSTVHRIRRDARQHKRKERVVYFIAGGDLVKIGKTFDVEARLRGLQCGSPVPLTLLKTTPGYTELETALHNHFADRRRHGEWFDVTLAEVDTCLADLARTPEQRSEIARGRQPLPEALIQLARKPND
jgi:T5orf172 domain